MSAKDNKSLQIPTFNGKENEFALFWPRFQACATLKKFSKVLKKTCNLPNDPNSLLSTSSVAKKQQELIDLNDLALALFTMAFTTGKLMEYIEESKTTEYNGGVASTVAERLVNKYQPADRISGVEAETELMKLKMKKNKDPDKFFGKLAILKNKYRKNSKTFDDEKMIAATIARAPKKYSAVLTNAITNKGASLTLDDMQGALKEH